MRFIGGWICGGLLAVAFMTQGASAATCVPQAEMQIIAQHFTQFQKLAGGEFCYDGSQDAGLIETIEFMRNIPFASDMPRSKDELFSGTFAKDWFGYFSTRINLLEVEDDCPKGVGAFVYMFGNTMHICPALLTNNFSSVDRISVMMHEARHIDGFPHIMCTEGPRAGIRGACDNKISDLGSYAVSVETYAQLGAYATDLHPALKAYARSSAVIYAMEAFETPARIDFTPQFLLMTTHKEFYKLPADGSAGLQRLGDTPALGHIVMRSRHMILFPDDKSLPSNFVFARNEGAIAQAAGDLAAEYNSQTPQERGDLVDMHIGAQWSARVYRNHVVFLCDPSNSITQDLPFNGELPASLVYPAGYDRAAPQANLVTESGTVLELGCAARKAYLRPSSVTLDQKYKRIYKSGDEVVGLTSDGRLFQVKGNSSTPLQTSADGTIHELVPSESYSFFENVPGT